jgi:gliding motility-associated-like protein
MKKYLLLTLFLPLISFGQNCDTVTIGVQHADTIIYCVTDASCHDACNGSIEVTVRGSNQPYSFSWGIGSVFVAGDNYRDSLCANQYIISIIDVNGNLVNNTYVNNLFSPPNWTYYEDSVKNPSCFNYDNGKIYLSIGGAIQPYAYSWDDGTNTEDRDSLDSGWYVLTTTDSNNCFRIDSILLTDPAIVTSSTITDTLSCIDLCDGEAIVTPADGIAPYTYLWSNGDTDSIGSGLCYGTNTVTITDVNNCVATNLVFIENPDTLKLSNKTIDNACYEICDGQISVSIEGGQSPYTTAWSFGGSIVNLLNDTLTNNDLCPGDYQLIFIDANGCDSTVIITLIERDSFTLSPLITPEVCHNSCTGRIEVSLLDEEYPPIQYIWPDLGLNSDSIFDLCSDTFELVVIDEESCSDTFELFVAPGDSMYFDSVAVTHNSCYGDTSGVISINFNGGVLPLDYDWSNSDSTSGINSLASGFYTVIVTDANGCSIDSSNIEVSQPDLLFATPSLENVSCFGASDGLIDIDIFGGVEPYFISWDNLIPDSTLIDTVPAGEYIYTIVDDSLCILSDTLIIEEPAELVMSDSLIDVLCKGESTGEIHLTVIGGISPYEYSVDSGVTFQSQAYFDNLSAGSYSIIVKDANDCLLNSPLYNISEPSLVLSAGLNPPNLLCFSDTGTILLTVSGGTPSYTYSWSNGVTTQDLNGVGAGNYLVTILDANGCELIKDTIVTEPDEIIVSEVITDLSCFEDGTGAIDISITGGIAPYVLSWLNGETTSYIDELDANTYTLSLTDGNGCTDSYNYDVEQPVLLTVTTTEIHISCFSYADGEIDATVSGGTSPFNYAWSNLTSNEDLFNIPTGAYDVMITDAHNCKDSASVNINEPTEIIFTVNSIDLICNNEFEGEILIAGSGGTPGYSYSIDGEGTYSNGSDFLNLQAGNYSVWIQDVKGCKKNQTVVLNQPIGFSTIVDIQNIEGCNGDATGIIDFSINGNTSPYTYKWTTVPEEHTSSIYNLSSGNYEVEVTDANSCEITYSYFVSEPEAIFLDYDIQLASCEEKNDGAITTMVIGGTAPYYYQWGTGETSSDIFYLSKGQYSLSVSDSKGCTLPIEYFDVSFDGLNGCIEIPSGFTPNNDNIHDEWVIYGLDDFPDVVVKIYNRWGQEIYSSQGYKNPWDGKYNGVDLPTAAYYYVIELNESDKVFNGTVTIKR